MKEDNNTQHETQQQQQQHNNTNQEEQEFFDNIIVINEPSQEEARAVIQFANKFKIKPIHWIVGSAVVSGVSFALGAAISLHFLKTPLKQQASMLISC
jgi:hypothetical protein